MNNFKRIMCVISMLLMFCSKFIFNIPGFTPEAIQILGIFIGAIILWLFVAIDWTSVMVLLALSMVPGIGISKVMSSSLGNNTIAFLIFSMILTYSLSSTGVLRRIALTSINSKWASKGPWHFLFMYLLSVLLIGSFIAPTVLFLLFYSLVQEIYTELDIKKGNRYAKLLMVGTAIVTSISCAMTPIAHTFPLMALGFYENETGIAISYFEYLKYGLPIGLILFVILLGILYLLNRKHVGDFPTIKINSESLQNKTRITFPEIIASVVFLIVVCMWMLIGIIPSQVQALKALSTTGPAMMGICMLSLICYKGKPILNFSEAIVKGVSWKSIMLCSATLALGSFLTSADFGITTFIGEKFATLLNGASVHLIILLITAMAIILTNLMSNIVTTTVVYNISMPVIIAMVASGINIRPELITIIIGLGASLAYATPPAIAHIAIAAGSEWATPKDMLKYGGIMVVISVIIVWLVSLI